MVVFDGVHWDSKSKKDNYRIYSRISREILDKNRTFYLSFDLYAGQQKLEFKKYRIEEMQ
jgi:hypothetical protein